MATLPHASDHRRADHPIAPLFVNRWSPRAMTGEAVADDELDLLFEAARWAPSSYNEQPWRFLYAKRGDAHWNDWFGLLVEGNRAWAKDAGVLIAVVVHEVFKRHGKPNPVAVFDCGSAWENLALQGSLLGLVTHGMAGFDRERSPAVLGLRGGYSVIAMIAVGRPGDPDLLPEGLRQQEVPSGRMAVAEIAFRGTLPAQ